MRQRLAERLAERLGGEAEEPEGSSCVAGAEGDEEDVVQTSTTKRKKRCTSV